VFEHPVTALEPEMVVVVADMLLRAAEAVAASVPELGELQVPYVRGRLVDLRDFYAKAAERQLAVALWWD
jgi:hypothetical protein